MSISIIPIDRIFKTYLGQARIAELNNKNPVKRVQGQRDRVSISKAAREALASHAQGQSPQVERKNVETQFVQTQFVQTEENAPQEVAV